MFLAFINAAFAITGCEQCCMPGGTCDQAYKQTQGICCGRLDAASFCCPTGASCFKCKSGRYRCYAGPSNPACTICDDGDDPRPQCNTNFGSPNLYDTMMVVFGVVLVCGLCACMNRNSMQQPTYYAQPVATAVPYSVGNQMHYATPYRQYGGYSGGTVAGSAGAGFLGGLLVGEAIGDAGHHHHRHHHHGGGWGGGGGGWGGGGGGGGGSSGFSADN